MGLASRKLHWPALARLRARFSVIGFADPVRLRAEEFAALAGLPMTGYSPDYQGLLRSDIVDAVLVAVPIAQLFSVARDCIEAGKHVLCEKPPGIDDAEGRAFVALVDAHPNQVVLMGENFFYRDEVRLARHLIDEGAIGQPKLLAQRWLRQSVPEPGQFSGTPWRYQNVAYRGGPLLDGGIHGVATIRMLGGDVSRIAARLSWVNPTMEAPSALTMTFDLTSGAIGDCIWGFFAHAVPESVYDTQVIGDSGGLIVAQGHIRLVAATAARSITTSTVPTAAISINGLTSTTRSSTARRSLAPSVRATPT